MFSIGVRSGEKDGQSRTLILFFHIKSLIVVRLAVLGYALSDYYMQPHRFCRIYRIISD